MTSRLERLIAIDETIRSGCYPSLASLCGMFYVKERTIYEDIRYLREQLGLDIQSDRIRNGYYNATPSKSLPAIDFHIEDLKLLVMACQRYVVLSAWKRLLA